MWGSYGYVYPNVAKADDNASPLLTGVRKSRRQRRRSPACGGVRKGTTCLWGVLRRAGAGKKAVMDMHLGESNDE